MAKLIFCHFYYFLIIRLMVLPATGNTISFSDIQTEFGGVNPITISEYYNNNSSNYVVNIASIPSTFGQTLSMSFFNGKSKTSTPTLPTIVSNGVAASLTQNGTYYYYTFTSITGTNTINFGSAINCSILVVGGGGGGFGGSGGGGGNVNYKGSYAFNSGLYTITVGAGGTGGKGYSPSPPGRGGLVGNPSKISFNSSDLIVANGGGASDTAYTSAQGYHAANGGGSSANINNAITNYSGGNGWFNSANLRWVSGGGAGAGGNGVSGMMTGNTLNSYGNGGPGYTSSITQTSVIYAGGGAGAPAAGGVTTANAGIDGTGQANYGGGGRGYSNDTEAGQAGKNGCVIIAFTFP